MFSQYFGHYLLNRGLISREQLKDALDYQKSVHVKFGVIAVDEGYMTPSQVEEVHEMQKKVDRRFGEIAVELGYLTEEQVQKMLETQKQNHLLLAQALVDRGYMTIEEFSQALNDYKEEHSLSDDKFEQIKDGNIDVLVENIFQSDEDEKRNEYIPYISLFAKNMIRFIDSQVYLEISKLDEQQKGLWAVQQEITGEAPMFTSILANEDVFLYIASKYAEEELTEVDELAEASVSEFLNLHNGIYLVNMSNRGVELNMKPQDVLQDAIVEGDPDLLVIDVNISAGTFKLLLTNDKSKISITGKKNNQLLI